MKQYRYRIDSSDRICYVDEHWQTFAKENDAAELTAEAVQGQDLWRFIGGIEVRNVYEEIFRILRRQRHEVILPFRCDSQERVRHMEMLMRSGPNGSIDFEGRLVHEETRAAVPLFSRSARRLPESVRICSFCRRLESGKDWIPATDAVTRNRWFSGTEVPKLEESVCPACRRVDV